VILGLDMSLTATGWAVVDRPGVHITDLIPDTRGHIAHRLARWQTELDHILQTYQPNHILIEDLPRSVRHGGPELGMIHAAFWLADIHLDSVTRIPPATLKTFATGRGNAGKDEMLAEAIRRLGYQGHDHNESDALWLAQLGAHLHSYPNLIELPAPHTRALNKIKVAA
jgi:Holliday junction resolvasome RuvABC endonuclease subunit